MLRWPVSLVRLVATNVKIGLTVTVVKRLVDMLGLIRLTCVIILVLSITTNRIPQIVRDAILNVLIVSIFLIIVLLVRLVEPWDRFCWVIDVTLVVLLLILATQLQVSVSYVMLDVIFATMLPIMTVCCVLARMSRVVLLVLLVVLLFMGWLPILLNVWPVTWLV